MEAEEASYDTIQEEDAIAVKMYDTKETQSAIRGKKDDLLRMSRHTRTIRKKMRPMSVSYQPKQSDHLLILASSIHTS
jgi:hypothetical protein